MAKVVLREGENFDSLVRRFKKLVAKENILYDYSKHEYFLKKNVKRQLKSKMAKINNKRG